jgi:uncharacterized protein (DUF2236 family)
MRVNIWFGTALVLESARQVLGLTWTEGDQRRLRLFATAVRRTWPYLSQRARHFNRAGHDMPDVLRRRITAGHTRSVRASRSCRARPVLW